MNFLDIARFMKQFYSKEIRKKNWYVGKASLLSFFFFSLPCLLPFPQILDFS